MDGWMDGWMGKFIFLFTISLVVGWRKKETKTLITVCDQGEYRERYDKYQDDFESAIEVAKELEEKHCEKGIYIEFCEDIWKIYKKWHHIPLLYATLEQKLEKDLDLFHSLVYRLEHARVLFYMDQYKLAKKSIDRATDILERLEDKELISQKKSQMRMALLQGMFLVEEMDDDASVNTFYYHLKAGVDIDANITLDDYDKLQDVTIVRLAKGWYYANHNGDGQIGLQLMLEALDGTNILLKWARENENEDAVSQLSEFSQFIRVHLAEAYLHFKEYWLAEYHLRFVLAQKPENLLISTKAHFQFINLLTQNQTTLLAHQAEIREIGLVTLQMFANPIQPFGLQLADWMLSVAAVVSTANLACQNCLDEYVESVVLLNRRVFDFDLGSFHRGLWLKIVGDFFCLANKGKRCVRFQKLSKQKLKKVYDDEEDADERLADIDSSFALMNKISKKLVKRIFKSDVFKNAYNKALEGESFSEEAFSELRRFN